MDDSTVQLPDTPKSRQRYPQPSSQQPGCNFAVLELAVLLSLTNGATWCFLAISPTVLTPRTASNPTSGLKVPVCRRGSVLLMVLLGFPSPAEPGRSNLASGLKTGVHFSPSLVPGRNRFGAINVDAAVNGGHLDLRAAVAELALEFLTQREAFLDDNREIATDSSAERVR